MEDGKTYHEFTEIYRSAEDGGTGEHQPGGGGNGVYPVGGEPDDRGSGGAVGPGPAAEEPGGGVADLLRKAAPAHSPLHQRRLLGAGVYHRRTPRPAPGPDPGGDVYQRGGHVAAQTAAILPAVLSQH